MKTESCPLCEGYDYEQFTHNLEETITKCKWAVLGIFDADPPFGYSIGLTDQGWPELIVAGLSASVACIVINNMVKHFIADGVPDQHTDISHIVHGLPVRLEPVSDEQMEEYMHQAIARQMRVGPSPRALQIVYPDANGRWPDDPKCDATTVHAQMLPVEETVQ